MKNVIFLIKNLFAKSNSPTPLLLELVVGSGTFDSNSAKDSVVTGSILAIEMLRKALEPPLNDDKSGCPLLDNSGLLETVGIVILLSLPVDPDRTNVDNDRSPHSGICRTYNNNN